MHVGSKHYVFSINSPQTHVLRLWILAIVVFIASFQCLPSYGAVLVTGEELRQAREHIMKEPLESYFRTLSEGSASSDAAPFLYLLTGEEKYARATRAAVRENLGNLRRYLPYKINIWSLYGPGWVESAVLGYDMTKESGLYTEEDIRELKETLAWSVRHYLNEGKDHLGKGFLYQTDYIPEDVEDWVTANMNVHRFVAVGLYALAFPGESRAHELLRYTVDYFERVLSLGARPGGAWSENPRYMNGVLKRLFLLAAGLKNAGVHDFFQDERFKGMLGFFAESIPVPGMNGPNRPTMLGAGDTDWYENGTTILSWAAPRYFEEEPETAGQWTWCWKNAGSPLSVESLLFVDPDIEQKKPAYKSYLPGMGYVVLRDRFAEPDETFFFATFGPELGTSNRAMHHHPNHGDFSLIWRGYPLMLTRGCSSYMWSRRMRDQADFSHSVVTFDGAGGTLAIPEKKYGAAAVEVNENFDERLVRDYYPDGITNFVTTPDLEYSAGEVRNWDIGIPAPFNVRHFLHLKPDVFVIWDQVRSPYPLTWNLHLPAEVVTSTRSEPVMTTREGVSVANVAQTGNRLHLTTKDGVHLSIDFLQDEPLDYTLDWPLESIRAEWPLVLSCPWGKGTFIFNALDITRQVLAGVKGARRILENLLSYPERPRLIGLIETDGQTASALEMLGLPYELLAYDDLAGDLARFDMIIVGHFGMLVRDRDLMDYREKLWRYVEQGGVCYWAYQFAWGWKPGDTSGPGYFPRALMVGEGTSVLWGEGIELDRPVTFDAHDPLFNGPNTITPEDWCDWQIGPPDTLKLLHYHEKPNTDRARNVPVYYSDYWKVHASALRTYNIQVPRTRKRFGPYRWIKVHHEASDDFFTILRPWKEGATGNAPLAEIVRGTENEAVIRQGDTCWHILLGSHPGLTGNIAVLRYEQSSPVTAEDGETARRFGPPPAQVFLADALDAEIGGRHFSFEHPATFFFREDDASGRISLLEGGNVTLPWKLNKAAISGWKLKVQASGEGSTITLPGGDYAFVLRGHNLELTRESHVGQVELVDKAGRPLTWVHIFRDLTGKGRTSFQGATDKHGRLTMRWQGKETRKISIVRGKETVRRTIKPGVQKIVLE